MYIYMGYCMGYCTTSTQGTGRFEGVYQHGMFRLGSVPAGAAALRGGPLPGTPASDTPTPTALSAVSPLHKLDADPDSGRLN